jgi:hypothetical protein
MKATCNRSAAFTRWPTKDTSRHFLCVTACYAAAPERRRVPCHQGRPRSLQGSGRIARGATERVCPDVVGIRVPAAVVLSPPAFAPTPTPE